MVYRQPARGTRVEEAIAAVEEAEARFLPAFWQMLAAFVDVMGDVFDAAGLPRDAAERVEARLAERFRARASGAATEEELGDIEDEARERARLLREVADRIDAIEDVVCHAFGGEAPIPRDLGALKLWARVPDGAVATLSRFARSHDEDAVVRREEDGHLVWARFDYGAAPIAVAVRSHEMPLFAARTRVPLVLPTLSIEPQTWRFTLGQLFGNKRDLKVGDDELDPILAITGDERTVEALREPPVRNALIALCRRDVPFLEIAAGFATIRVSHEPSQDALEAASRVLRGLHDFVPTVALAQR